MRTLTSTQRQVILSKIARYEKMAFNLKRQLEIHDIVQGTNSPFTPTDEFMLKISNEVALYLDIPHSKIFVKDRNTKFVFARTVLICLLSLAGYGITDIAWFIKMHHTTILFHTDKIDGVDRFYPELAEALQNISQILTKKGIVNNIYSPQIN